MRALPPLTNGKKKSWHEMVNAAVQCSRKSCLRGCAGKIAQEWCILIKNDLAAVQLSVFVLELWAMWLLQRMRAATGKVFALHVI